MKYCPNPDCPYAKKHARPGEYVDTASLCTDCGAQLGAAPPVALPPVAAPLIVKPSDANRRLVVTLGAAVALGVLSWLPVVGAPESVFGGSSLQAPMRMLAVGMVPFMSAFTVVELLALMLPGLRAVRVGGTKARATLDRTAWVLGFVLLGVQLFGVDRYLRSSDFAVPPPALLWAQWLLAHLAMLGLAFLVTRSGLGHGLALVMV